MKNFNDYLNDSGFNSLPPVPKNKVIYFAYKNGEAKEFSNLYDAEKFSSITERVVRTPSENAEHVKLIYQKQTEAFDNWYKDLREEWKCMSDDIFNVCYSDASNKRNSYDEIANNFDEYSEFVSKIILIVLAGNHKD